MTQEATTAGQTAAVIAGLPQLLVEHLRKALRTTEVVVAEINTDYLDIRGIRVTSMAMRYRGAK